MDHVLVRFHAIAGFQNLEWLKLVSTIRNDKLVHDTFKALICGLDITTTIKTRRQKCVGILLAIQKRLSSLYKTRCLNTVHLVFLVSYHELVVWNNPKAWMMHIWDLSTIVQTIGPDAFRGILELRTLKQKEESVFAVRDAEGTETLAFKVRFEEDDEIRICLAATVEIVMADSLDSIYWA
jgi:hypothetical protein